MKRQILIGFATILLIGLSIYTISSMLPKTYISIQNDGVYFDMSEKQLMRIKGTPIKIDREIGDTPFDRYVFADQLYGYQAESEYHLLRTWSGLKLRRAFMEVKNLNYEAARELLDRITDSLKKQYSKKRGFYEKELQGDDISFFSFGLGVNEGATGIDFYVDYEDGTLLIATFLVE